MRTTNQQTKGAEMKKSTDAFLISSVESTIEWLGDIIKYCDCGNIKEGLETHKLILESGLFLNELNKKYKEVVTKEIPHGDWVDGEWVEDINSTYGEDV